jgi:methylated-DNA-protein-cysteine methyltransferase related protein
MAISKGKKAGLKKAGRKAAAKKGAGAKAAPKKVAVREKLIAVKPSGSKEDNFYDLVHEVARQIPRGRVTSYGAIAAALGTRGSSRMVGWAMMAVPYADRPVPAHRVVNRAGLLTGRHHYKPPEKMQQLLEADGVKVIDNQVVDFEKLFWDPSQEL